MLTYSPQKEKYPGDERMRAVTGLPKLKRAGNKKRAAVSISQLRAAKRHNTSRLCGNLDKLCLHVASIKKTNTGRICAWCGKQGAYAQCGKCKNEKKKPVALHYNNSKGEGQGALCFFHYHNDSRFGLGKNDSSTLLNQTKGDWEEPTAKEIDDNRSHIESLGEQL